MLPNLERLLEFHALLSKFQTVERITHVPETYRKENDTEHSYNLAMMAWFLCQYFPELNANHVITYALAHDLVEVHAGDTYVLAAQSELDSKIEREAAALKQLRIDWADFPGMLTAITEYETRNSAEARFVYALDKIMPILVIILADGYTWKHEDITLDKLHAIKVDKVAVSPEIKPYYEQIYNLLLNRPDLISPK